MSMEKAKSFFEAIQSHLFVALITAIVTISYALGSYRDKIDTLMTENAQTRSITQKLDDSMTDLRVEVGKLRLEMELNRINNSK